MKRLLTILTVLACLGGTNKPLSAQFAETGGGLPYRSPAFGGGVPLERGQYAQSGNVLLFLSKSGDAVWGFSATSGKWAKQPLSPAAEKIKKLVLSNKVGGFQVGQKVYAFSGSACRWDTLKIPQGQDAVVQFIAGADLFIAQVGSDLFIFSPQTGRWTPAEANAGRSNPGGSSVPLGGGNTSYGSFSTVAEPRSVTLARQIQQLKASGGDASKRVQLAAQLRQAVAEEFQQRQQRHKDDLIRLKKRLEQIERLIKSREKAKDAIINRRIEELLNPALRWTPKNEAPEQGISGTRQ